MRVWTCRRFGCNNPASRTHQMCPSCEVNEPTLFPVDPPPPSLDELRLRDQQVQVLTALCTRHARLPEGSNAFELQAFLVDRDEDRGIERNAISSRFRELADMGLVEQVGTRHAPTGKSEKVYAPTLLAHEWRKRAVAA